jgi:hypothetical protein
VRSCAQDQDEKGSVRGFSQNRQIGIALPLAVTNRIRRQNGGSRAQAAEQPQ